MKWHIIIRPLIFSILVTSAQNFPAMAEEMVQVAVGVKPADVPALSSTQAVVATLSVPPVPVPALVPPLVSQTQDSQLFERTSEKYRDLEKQVESLRNTIGALSVKLVKEDLTSGLNLLNDMERKAKAFEAMQVEIQNRDQLIGSYSNRLAETMENLTIEKALTIRLQNETNNLAQLVLKLEGEQKLLKESLEQFKSGKFEYYEIKPGDTCESIAARPTIFNESAKHVLIRQANSGNVVDLDKLVPGQILIIPRY